MESAFTGLVRKYRALFKPNKSITSHNTTACRFFIRSRVYLFIYFLYPLPAVFVSPTLAVPAAQLVLALANATGIKE